MAQSTVLRDTVPAAPAADVLGDNGDRPQTEPVAQEATLPSGPAEAAILGGGIGAALLGLIVTAAEASPPLAKALTFDSGVGPLSGKTTVAVIGWLLTWAVLHWLWRARDVGTRGVAVATAALVVVGLLGTFPPVYGAVAHLFGR